MLSVVTDSVVAIIPSFDFGQNGCRLGNVFRAYRILDAMQQCSSLNIAHIAIEDCEFRTQVSKDNPNRENELTRTS